VCVFVHCGRHGSDSKTADTRGGPQSGRHLKILAIMYIRSCRSWSHYTRHSWVVEAPHFCLMPDRRKDPRITRPSSPVWSGNGHMVVVKWTGFTSCLDFSPLKKSLDLFYTPEQNQQQKIS
jgi:hypothetical protein